MLLEKQLLTNIDCEHRAKRVKGTSDVSIMTETWVELARWVNGMLILLLLIFFVCVCVLRLYKSLDEYDVSRGIFCNVDGIKPVTSEALEAEERGDYCHAAQLYKEV